VGIKPVKSQIQVCVFIEDFQMLALNVSISFLDRQKESVLYDT